MKKVFKVLPALIMLLVASLYGTNIASAEEVTEQYVLKGNVTMYDQPTFLSEKVGSLAPQTVNVIEKLDNGWMEIQSYLGDNWIAPEGEKFDLPEYTLMYGEPSITSTTYGGISPQTLNVKDELDNGWMKIQSYLGDKWIAPESGGVMNEGSEPIVLASVATSDIKVKIDDRSVNFSDQGPIMSNSRVLVPIRVISEDMGYSVTYTGNDSQVVRIDKYNNSGEHLTRINIQVGSKYAYVTNMKTKEQKTVILDAIPSIVNGRTMVPLRFISEALGANVKWNGSNKTVTIINKGISKVVYKGKSTIVYLNDYDVKEFFKICSENHTMTELIEKAGGTGNPYVKAITKGAAKVVDVAVYTFESPMKSKDQGRGLRIYLYAGKLPVSVKSQ
ncbi:copper amine oxidase N-terminal domain-containing protein [Priestia megaterium]|uniref:copper amine oxidase N-terminal domain-containing protein n=1 Tax=Priestia megaterium TaxID=1404 RepID=UPI001DE145D9|nr:copper amine oxidase N-terminal domain-containing protein [Priestia megaterium]